MQKDCGPCPDFARYTLAFALKLRKKKGKTAVSVAEKCQVAKNMQNRAYMSIRIHKRNNKNTRYKTLTLRLLMSYIYGVPILDARSHTTTQHSR